jgi:hypothetical protein
MVWVVRFPGGGRNGDQSILRDMIVATQSQRFNDLLHIGDILKRQVFMSSRRARQLPIIDIGGTNFYLDIRLNQFRDVNNFANSISLDDLYETPDGDFKLGFDKRTKNLFTGTREVFDSAKHAVEVTLPRLDKMDPLGVLWKAEEDGWVSPEDAKRVTEELVTQFVVHESGMILQRKVEKPKLIEKKIRTNKQRGKRL